MKLIPILAGLAMMVLQLITPLYAADMSRVNVIGRIDVLGGNSITVNDMKFALSPTLKVIRKNNKPGTTDDLMRGKFVKLKFIGLGQGKNLVDSIYLIDRIPNESPMQEGPR